MGRTDKEIYRVIDNVNSYYRINSESKKELLLNKYPNAAAAYSLRLLDGYYRGPLVRVRRDDDGAEVDVYPDYNNQLSLDSLVTNVPDADDTTTNPDENADATFLKSLQSLGEFVGATGYSSTISATDATVCVWYDQSSTDGVPNDNDAKQVTALNQPLIVSSGVIVTDNGKPAVTYTSGTGVMLQSANFASPYAQPTSFFAIGASGGSSFEFMISGGESAELNHAFGTRDTSFQIFSGESINTSTSIDANQHLWSIVFDDPSSNAWQDGSQVVTNQPSGTSTMSRITLFNLGFALSLPWEGVIQELVFYNSDQSANRSDIEEDINSFYQIDGYTPTPKLIDLTQDLAVQNGGTTADGTPAAAYSLRLLSSTYNGPLVRIRRTIDNTEVDVYPDSDGEFSIYSTIEDGGTELTTGVTGGTTDKTTLHEFLYGQDTDCTVVRWYDQASGNHATQDVATSQPKIYDSSTGVVTENGKPVLSFDGNDDYLDWTTTSQISQPFSVFAVNPLQTDGFVMDSASTDSGYRCVLGDFGGDGWGIFGPIWVRATITPTTQSLNAAIYNTSASELYINGTIHVAGDVGANHLTNSSGYVRIGNRTSSLGRGINSMQEIIYYPSNQSGNRTGIESNINQHYNIY
jgi:hypothetical protein